MLKERPEGSGAPTSNFVMIFNKGLDIKNPWSLGSSNGNFAMVFNKGLEIGKNLEPENQALIYNALGFCYLSQEQIDKGYSKLLEEGDLSGAYTAFVIDGAA